MIDYKKTTLSNGLTIIVEQDTSTTLVAVNVLYKVGSCNENPERTGFAHLFEHLMFGGSVNAPDFDQPLQIAGGENNAFTNNDYTNFYNILPIENLETALWLEADRMMNLNISASNLETQRKVVIEEFKEVCLSKPYGDHWHHLLSLLYKEHGYAWPTIGKSVSHIEEITLGEVQTFYDQHYHPSNAVISISGPLAKEETLAFVHKWFGNIPNKIFEKAPLKSESPQTEMRSKRIHTDVPVPFFIGAAHMPKRMHKDYYACDLLSDILSNGMSSRFYNRFIKEEKLMSSVDCYISGYMDSGLIVFEGNPASGKSTEQCLASIWDEIENLSNHPPSERELKKIKNKVATSIAMNDINILNKAISMSSYEFYGVLDDINHQVSLYNQVSVDQIIDVARKYLIPTNTSIVEYVPTTEIKPSPEEL